MKKEKYILRKWYPGLPENFKGKKIEATYTSGRNSFQIFMNGHGKEIYITRAHLNETEYWRKEKEVLFISEDGVEIREGQSWFYVKQGGETVASTSKLTYNGSNPKPVTRYHSKELALKHASLNKLRKGLSNAAFNKMVSKG